MEKTTCVVSVTVEVEKVIHPQLNFLLLAANLDAMKKRGAAMLSLVIWALKVTNSDIPIQQRHPVGFMEMFDNNPQ